MAQYAIAFDLDTRRMTADGLTKSDVTNVYQAEIPDALRAAGFPAHIQGSVYRTDAEQSQLRILVDLQRILHTHAPRFCTYVKTIHIFRVEEISEITDLLSTYSPPAE
jgi:virulence-associated protein VapD